MFTVQSLTVKAKILEIFCRARRKREQEDRHPHPPKCVFQEREEREEIEKELREQNDNSLNLIRPLSSDEGSNGAAPRDEKGHKVVDNSNNNTERIGGVAVDLQRRGSPPVGKEPPPLGLAGLEAFRREYLTSPLSHLRAAGSGPPQFPPNFPPILPHPQNLMNSIAESGFGLGGFGKSGSNRGPPPPSSSSSGGTPPASHATPTRSPPQQQGIRSPSSEFTSQQNWSFEEQFKQVFT